MCHMIKKYVTCVIHLTRITTSKTVCGTQGMTERGSIALCVYLYSVMVVRSFVFSAVIPLCGGPVIRRLCFHDQTEQIKKTENLLSILKLNCLNCSENIVWSQLLSFKQKISIYFTEIDSEKILLLLRRSKKVENNIRLIQLLVND